MDKYELLTEMAKAFDERDHLRRENDVLENLLHEFKFSKGAEELTPQVAKVYRYGVEKLAKQCFSFDWYNIGVDEVGGEPCPSVTVDQWAQDCKRSNKVPEEFSIAEVFTICMPYINKRYDMQWAKEEAEWRAERGGEEGE